MKTQEKRAKRLAIALILSLIAVHSAEADQKKMVFGGRDALALAEAKEVLTDCRVTAPSPVQSRLLCFSNKQAKLEFSKNEKTNFTKAQAFYKTLPHGTSADTAQKLEQTETELKLAEARKTPDIIREPKAPNKPAASPSLKSLKPAHKTPALSATTQF